MRSSKSILGIIAALLLLLTGCMGAQGTVTPTPIITPTPDATPTPEADPEPTPTVTITPEDLGYTVPEFDATHYFGDSDLDFFGVSMLATKTGEILASYGEPSEKTAEFMEATGASMLIWKYPGITFTFTIDDAQMRDDLEEILLRENGEYDYVLEAVDVGRDDFIGPRGVRVGMPYTDVLTRFPDDGLEAAEGENTLERLLYYKAEGLEGFPPIPPFGMTIQGLDDPEGTFIIEYCYPQNYEDNPDLLTVDDYMYAISAYLYIQVTDGVVETFSVFYIAMAE